MHTIFTVIFYILVQINRLCFNRYKMYRHFLWFAFGNISIAVSLLAQSIKYCVTCRNSQQICFLTSHTTLINSIVLWK